MFRPNALKQRLTPGGRALGCWTVLGSPPVIELLALCGFDYLLIDQEHGFGEPSALLSSLQAMAATPACTSVVRVPSNDVNYLKRVLDAGVEGVMVPNIETADDARAVVAACRYPPAGRRGSALGSARASDYGIHAAKYREAAADEVLIICQIESPKAIDNIDAIAAEIERLLSKFEPECLFIPHAKDFTSDHAAVNTAAHPIATTKAS